MAKFREFMGRRINKETVSLGVRGEITRDDGFPELPPLARVEFKAVADYENLKHKFRDDGKVDEALILTIDPESFEVLGVTERPVQETLPVDEDQPELDQGEPTDLAARRRGRGRTGKDDS